MRGPLIIGATGGSGTRLLANLLIGSDEVYLGKNHNPAMDCLDFKDLYDRWIPKFASCVVSPDTGIQWPKKMRLDFALALRNYQQQLPANAEYKLWGWKGPRSMYLLPFFADYFSNLKFVHMVRDGRDMAFSENQNQMYLYAAQLLPDYDSGDVTGNSFRLWSTVNYAVAMYGEEKFGANYFRLKYEDLVMDSEKTIRELSHFLSLDERRILSCQSLISSRGSINRWQARATEAFELQIRNNECLNYFGYT
jgi:hypothetical protein